VNAIKNFNQCLIVWLIYHLKTPKYLGELMMVEVIHPRNNSKSFCQVTLYIEVAGGRDSKHSIKNVLG